MVFSMGAVRRRWFHRPGVCSSPPGALGEAVLVVLAKIGVGDEPDLVLPRSGRVTVGGLFVEALCRNSWPCSNTQFPCFRQMAPPAERLTDRRFP